MTHLDEMGKASRLGEPRAFHFGASAFGSLGGRGVKNPMFLTVWSLVSSETPTIKNERFREGKDTWQEE